MRTCSLVARRLWPPYTRSRPGLRTFSLPLRLSRPVRPRPPPRLRRLSRLPRQPPRCLTSLALTTAAKPTLPTSTLTTQMAGHRASQAKLALVVPVPCLMSRTRHHQRRRNMPGFLWCLKFSSCRLTLLYRAVPCLVIQNEPNTPSCREHCSIHPFIHSSDRLHCASNRHPATYACMYITQMHMPL
jgi:hypothetical protein